MESLELRPFDQLIDGGPRQGNMLKNDTWRSHLDFQEIRSRIFDEQRRQMRIALCNSDLVTPDLMAWREKRRKRPHPSDAIARFIRRSHPYIACNKYEKEETGVCLYVDPDLLKEISVMTTAFDHFASHHLNAETIKQWTTSEDYRLLAKKYQKHLAKARKGEEKVNEWRILSAEIAELCLKLLLKKMAGVFRRGDGGLAFHLLGSGSATSVALDHDAKMKVAADQSVKFYGINRDRPSRRGPDWEVDSVCMGQRLIRLFEITTATFERINNRLRQVNHRPELLLPLVDEKKIRNVHRFFVHIPVNETGTYDESSSPKRTRVIQLTDGFEVIKELTEHCLESVPAIKHHYQQSRSTPRKHTNAKAG